MLVYPRAQRVITNTQLLALGTIEILPPVAPLTIFVWGPKRALPVKLTEFSITEEAHDLEAEPDPRQGLARACACSATATCRSRTPATRCSSRTRSPRRRWRRIGGSGSLADVGGGGLNLADVRRRPAATPPSRRPRCATPTGARSRTCAAASCRRAPACRCSSRSRSRQGDRLDLITARTLGDPEAFWRVCDANDALDPAELTSEAGRRLRVPLPQP